MSKIEFNLQPLNKGRYYVYIASEFCSSQPIPQLLTGYSPIFISGVRPKYAPDNFIYVSKRNAGEKLSHTDFYKTRIFYDLILESDEVQSLFRKLADRQGELWIKPFRNDVSFAPQFEDRRIKCLGLSPEQADELNDKTYQYGLFEGKLPLPRHVIVKAKDVAQYVSEVRSDLGVFIAGAYGAGGSTTFVARTLEELKANLDPKKYPRDEELILAECLNLKESVSVDLIVANPNEVIPYCVLGQSYDPGNILECKGNIFPAVISPKEKKEVVEIAREAGRILAEEGVRGHLSFDMNIDQKGNVYFGEINARYTAATAERFLLMELSRPRNHPTLMDLEKMAVEKGTFSGHGIWEEPKGLYFARREVESKIDGKALGVAHTIPDESVLFKQGGSGIIGSLPEGAPVTKVDTLGKVVCVSDTPEVRDRTVMRLEQILMRGVVHQ